MNYLVLVVAVALISMSVTTVNAQQRITMERLPNIIHDDWDPPSSGDELLQMCGQQAQMNNIDPQQYCTHVGGFCGQFGLNGVECYAYNFVEIGEIPKQERDSLLQKVYNQQPQQQEQMPPEQFQQQQLPSGGTGSLNDACLQSGFTQEQCNSYIGSSDPGGYCTTLKQAGLPCPQIQDPSDTYGDPERAIQESEQKKQQIDNAIEGYDRLYPPGKGLD